MTKQAWYNNYTSEGYRYWQEVELTGNCKKTTGGPEYDKPRQRVEIRWYSWFGLVKRTEYVMKSDIKICDTITEEIYECDCFKEAQDATG
jgi:hypothetical protein